MDSKIEKSFQNSQFYRNYNNADFVILKFQKIKNDYTESKNKYKNELQNKGLDKIITNLSHKNNIDNCNKILLEKIKISHNIKKYVKYSKNINDDFIISVNIGNIKNIEILLKNGADIHDRDDRALRWSSYNEHIEVVKFLINTDLEYFSKNEIAKNFVIKHNLIEFYEKFDIK